MLLCSCNACCCLHHQIKQTERKAHYFFTAISPRVWASDDVQNMQWRAYERKAWWVGSNWEWQCALPGAFFVPFFSLSTKAAHRGTSKCAQSRTSEFTTTFMVRACPSCKTYRIYIQRNETTRSVFPSNQVISPQTGTSLRKQSSQILIIIPALLNTDLLGMFSFPSMHVFQGCSQPAEKLLEGRVRLCLPFCTFHLPPGGTESNNQRPTTEVFPSEKPDTAKLHRQASYLLFLTPLSCLHHFISVETKG